MRAAERWELSQSINKYGEHMQHSPRTPVQTDEEGVEDLHSGQSGDQCTCYNYKNKKPPKSWDESRVQMWWLKWGQECKWQYPQIHLKRCYKCQLFWLAADGNYRELPVSWSINFRAPCAFSVRKKILFVKLLLYAQPESGCVDVIRVKNNK